MITIEELLKELRSDGWMVAVHNDYKLNGELWTFWLFTSGIECVKGEARNDIDALLEIRSIIAQRELVRAKLLR